MLSFYLFFGILYTLLLRGLGKFWRFFSGSTQKPITNTYVSVILAYRNEAGNLGTLLDDVLKLSHRPLELVLVDDHSEDGGAYVIDAYQNRFMDSEIRLVSIRSQGMGKKSAIAQGVGLAKGEIILMTDADCRIPVDWVEGMVLPFLEAEVHLVAGPVMSSGNRSFFERFQQIEWASILSVTQAGFSLGNPIMCSAANLAFRKSAFLEVNGYDGNAHIPTGDDEFLLKKIVRKFGAQAVRYLSGNDVLVTTQPHARWMDMLSQRIRWASKWRMHRSFGHAIAAVLPVLFQLIWLFSLLLLFGGWQGGLVFCFIWILKIWYEKRVLGRILRGFSIAIPFPSFLVTSILHPWYVLGTAFGALFLNYTWKGRKFGVKQ